MAFLDNSGDIILDAVLTEVGRKKLTSGVGLNITKFALGDDEIDYRLFNRNHPSGSAYYDLQILQTPVFEAFTKINANINYGLLSFTREDILYMPTFTQNKIVNSAKFASTHQGLYYIAVNTETTTALRDKIFTTNFEKVTQAGTTGQNAPAYELGLNTTQLAKTQNNRRAYINQMGINDSRFTISINNLFISTVMGLGASTPAYENSLITNALTSFPTPTNLVNFTSGVPSKNRRNFTDFGMIRKSNNRIWVPTDSSTSTNAHSVIAGPSNAIVMFNVTVDQGMSTIAGGSTDRRYQQYGKAGQSDTNAFGSAYSSTYTWDYIDTSVYVTGNTTGATISVPVRLIRRAS